MRKKRLTRVLGGVALALGMALALKPARAEVLTSTGCISWNSIAGCTLASTCTYDTSSGRGECVYFRPSAQQAMQME